MAQQYLIGSGPMQTTAAFAVLATGTAIKTLLQVKPGATLNPKIVEWGISFDGTSGVPGKVELIETDVAATVTAAAAADITKFNGEALAGAPDPTTALIAVGTTSTGYNATAEGSIAAVRNLDGPILLPPTGPYVKQFPLGREPVIQLSKYARVRVTFPVTVNAYAYMILEF